MEDPSSKATPATDLLKSNITPSSVNDEGDSISLHNEAESWEETMRMSDDEDGVDSDSADTVGRYSSGHRERSTSTDSSASPLLVNSQNTQEPIRFDSNSYAAAVFHLDKSRDMDQYYRTSDNRRGKLVAYSNGIRSANMGGRRYPMQRDVERHSAAPRVVAEASRRETPLSGLRENLYRANIHLRQSYILLDFQCFKEDGAIIPCEFAIRAFVNTSWQHAEHPEQRIYQTANTQFGLVGATKPFSALSVEDKHTNNYRRQEIHGIWYTTHIPPDHMNQIIADTIASVQAASSAPTIIIMKGREKIKYFMQTHPHYRDMVRAMPEPHPATLQPCSRYIHHAVSRMTPSCAFANVHFMDGVLDMAGFFVA